MSLNVTDFFDKFCGSQFWDSNLTWYTDDPDLTPCFEKTVLVWIPFIFYHIFLPLEFYRIDRSRSKNIPWSWINISKMVVAGLLLIVDVAEGMFTALWGNSYPADNLGSLIQMYFFITLMTVVVFNKTRGLRVSYLLFFTSLLMVLCQTPQMYSFVREYLHSGIQDLTVVVMNIVIYVLKWTFFILQFFCDKPPIYIEYPTLERPSPEDAASIPSRLTYSWFTPLVQLGATKALEGSDMYSLDHENTSRVVVPNFDKHWNSPQLPYTSHSSRMGSYRTIQPQASILPALCKTFWPYFLVGSLFRLCQDLIVFVNPQLLKLLIRFVSSEESLWKGCLFATLMLICSNLQTFFVTRAFLTMHFLGNRIATALISVIYRKSLRLSNAARKQSTLGEVVNLMAVDASSFQQMMGSINLVWSAPLQVMLALYFLWGLLGPAALGGLGVLIMVIPLNGWLVRQTRLLRMSQMKHKDDRIKIMNEVLSGVKVLKLYAWEPSFEKQISSIRQKEIDVMKTAAFYNSLSSFLFNMTPFLVALASFALFVLYDDNNILDAETAFVSLSLFNILRFPLQQLPQVLNSVVMASVSVKRLNKYLNNEELDPQTVEHDSSERDAIVVENGTFSWDASDGNGVVLRDINIHVPAGALVAVVGTVGCGKSSLVSAILGEMDKLSGRIMTNGRIAYVPQQAWIQNSSLQKNITCFQEYDELTFRRVVGACALEQDIEMLPGGDMTEIGEKGINLSGGQKQRVSLARAVYSNADVYLLDDPLSAVDSHVGKHIFEHVIGPQGILRKKTRLLVTHGVTFLPYTNLIIVMKDGKVSESGTYKQLIENKGAFADFLMQYLEEAEGLGVESELGEIRDELLKDASLRDRFTRAISVRSEGAESLQRQTSKEAGTSSSRETSKKSPEEITNQPQKQENKKLITMEESQSGNVKLSVFLYYFRAVGVMMGLSAIICVILYQGFLVSGNLWLSWWSSDKSTVVNGTQNTSKTHLYLSVYAALGIGQAVCSVVSSLCLSLGCLFAATWLHATMLQRILRAPMSYFDTTPLGRIVNRFSKDIDTCDTILSFNLSAFLNLAVQVIATVSVITYSTPVFIFIIIPVMIFNLLLQRYFVATSRQLKRLESTSRSPIYSHFGETVQGASSIRAYKMQEIFTTQSEEKVDFNQACYYASLVASRWLAIRLELVSNMLVFFAALFAVLYRDSLEAGLAGLSISYALQVTGMLNFFVRTAADVETNIVAVERIKEYSEIDQEAAWSVQPKPGILWPQSGKLEFEDYRVRYREGLELVLSGISFKTLPSEKIGIVGRTGAGKSSLTLALFRILEAAGGAIFIDGVNIGSIGLHDLRSRITIIPQDPVLFSGTLRSNLDPFGKETDETLWKALELSNLMSFVKNLPAGLNHVISEGGENLSVGQKQLICLSRALLRKTKVLVLDEATAAVDLETDDIIQRTIRTEFQDCTVLTIAHRLNTIMDYNRILVLDKGKVKEFDAPNILIQNPNTIFHSMAKDAGLVS